MNSRIPDLNTTELPAELSTLGDKIAHLPRMIQEQLNPSYQEVVDSVLRRRRILTMVQDALAQLRLDIKYLMFDLEVTRDERDQLKKQLEEK